MRRVILLCGPPGAGKTTTARSLAEEQGLRLFDLDDAEWQRSERAFRAALAGLASDPAARAVVIRSGATRSARAKAAALVGATEVLVVATDAATCRSRVRQRNRKNQPLAVQLAAVDKWWSAYEPGGEDTPAVAAGPDLVAGLGVQSREW